MQTTNTWNLRSELYHALHRWPWLAAMFLVGAGLGWGASYIWPAYARSTQPVYVALNPYRAFSDSNYLAAARPKYSNIDNYHYWQMAQLDAFIKSPAVLEKTLAALRQSGAEWGTVETADLQPMLSTEWRTAGEWQLTAVDGQAQRAQQAVQAWSSTAAEAVTQAVFQSQELLALDPQLQQAAQDLGARQDRLAALNAAVEPLAQLRHALAQLPAEQAVDAELRWQLAGAAARIAVSGAAWNGLMAGLPGHQATAAQALGWLDDLRSLADADRDALPAQVDSLAQRHASLLERYRQAQHDSYALSPNLAVETTGAVSTQTVRRSSLLALVGGFAGLLGGVMLALLQAARRSGRDE
ncbi:MAG: hypothetical protein ACKOC5_00340 [Chloroflexota bacterium]